MHKIKDIFDLKSHLHLEIIIDDNLNWSIIEQYVKLIKMRDGIMYYIESYIENV